MKKISLITPCYNAEKNIEETIHSVVCQTALMNGTLSLEYIFCDGGSTDKTVETIENSIRKISAQNYSFQVYSEKDNGMYEALSKGLKKVTGDYCAYINAGDFYAPYAFEIISEIFENENIKWLTGSRVHYNEKSQVISMRSPLRYRKPFIRKGFYGLILPYIQQESTFWKSELNGLFDHSRLSALKMAGDYYLWHSFAEKADLFIVESYLAGFKIQKGQKSENHAEYQNEVSQFIRNRYGKAILYTPLILYDLLYYIPDIVKKRLNTKTLITFDHGKGVWKLARPL
jgi:glycosyltransferase involved in cell wall biosynthesis